jgi:predicted transposase/invertase (TIGR01784 family)
MELPKFNKKIDQLENLNEKWAYFFKHAEYSTIEEMENLIGHDVIIKRAFQAIDQASWSEEELRSYEHSVKVELDNLVVEQQKLEDAKAEGEARGKIEGKIAIAKKMLLKGSSLDEVIEMTGLREEEILGK